MKNDFIKDLEYLGFATRLKRISDSLMHDGRKLYKELGLDIEPNWYVIFKLLNEHEPLTVTDISNHLQFSHPSVINILTKMEKAGYLNSIKNSADNRKRVLTLSKKAIQKQAEYEVIWVAATEGITKALEGLNALEFITQLEQRLSEKPFNTRALESLNTKS